MKKFLAKVLFLMLTFSLFLFYKSSFSYESENFDRINDFYNTSSAPTISSSNLSGGTLTINFSAPTIGGTPTSYEFSTTGTSPWTTLSVSGTTPNLVGTVSGLSPTLTEFYIRAVYGSTETLLNTYPKPMTSGWSQILPATNSTKTYKMVVSGTWGIANGRAHRDAAYDAGSNNTIGVSGTPVANRGCDANWLFEGACPPPVPTSPAGYATNNTYEYTIGIGKTAGYSISFSDGGYWDNTGTLTFKLYETTASTNGTPVRGSVSGGTPTVPGMPSISTSTLSGTTLTINFAAPTTGGAPTGYEFSTTATTWSTLSYTTSGANLVGTVSNVSPSLTTYYIRAINASGSGTSATGSVSGGTPTVPGMPSISTSTLSGTTLTINFAAPTTGGTPTGYEFSATGTTAWTTLSISGTSPYLVGTVTSFSGSVFYIRAVNASGNGASVTGSVSGGSPSIPGVPSLTSATLSGTTLTVNFTAPSSGGTPTGYQYRNAGGSWLSLNVTNLPALNSSGTGTVSGFNGTVNSSIELRALINQDFGSASNSVMITGSGPNAPLAPTINSAILSGTTLTINLTAPNSGVYEYQYRIGASGNWSPVTLMPLPAPNQQADGTVSSFPGIAGSLIYLRGMNADGEGAPSNPAAVKKVISSVTVNSIPNQTYSVTGSAPSLSLVDGNSPMVLVTDFTVAYTNNTNVGTATATITGTGNYTGTRLQTFTIIPKAASTLTIEPIANQTYSGAALTPSLVVKDGNTTLSLTTDYTVAYTSNTNVGTATATITGAGNYTSTKTQTFSIVAKAASTLTIDPIANQTFTGAALTPAIVVKNGNTTLTLGTDYSVAYTNNTNAGTATVTITGAGNYTGTKTQTFSIVKLVSSTTIDPIANQTFTGSAIAPSVVVKDGNTTLSLTTDYTIAYTANTNVGTATVTITGAGNYSGTKTQTFTIVAKAASTLTIDAIANQIFTGAALTPAIVVKDGNNTLTLGSDYSVAYTNNTNAGTATVTITGAGNYTGTKTQTFSIVKLVSSTTIDPIANQTYSGTAIAPAAVVKDGNTILTLGTDYTVAFTNNTNVGTATVTITGAGNFTGTKSQTFTIVAKDASTLTIDAVTNQTYSGSALTPALVVKDGNTTLSLTTDYTVAYTSNTNVGTATATITGAGNYTSTKTQTFSIVAKAASTLTIDPIANQTFTGAALTPAIVVKNGNTTLTLGTDYSVAYTNNTNAGTATVTITGAGNYTGTKTQTFSIVKLVSSTTIDPIANQTFTGSAIAPSVVVKDGNTTLSLTTDYTVAYTNNTNVGISTVTITGAGNYSGTKTQTFTIVAKAVTTLTIDAIANQTFTGAALTPAIVVKDGNTALSLTTDYTVAYTNNTNTGTATVTITGAGNYIGTKTQTFSIVKLVSSTTIDPIANQTYSGTAIAPAAVVKDGNTILTLGTDYTVAFTNNTNVGTATVTITGAGNFTGTKSQTFTIVAKDASTLTIDAVTNQTYSGSALTPALVVKDGNTTLSLTTAYTVAYTSNTNVGTATATITGAGNYTGTKIQTFAIVPKAASSLTIEAIANQTYTGSALTPAIVVKDGTSTLTLSTDYTLAYTNNTNVGTATVTITGAGNYSGTKTQTFAIAKPVGPSSLSYSPATQTVRQGTAIDPLIPTISGGTPGYTISPALPAGLSINATSGILSGTLTATRTGSVTYTVTATNLGGSTTAEVTLVFNTAPTGISLEPSAVAENVASGTTVGPLTATDQDAGDTHTYALVSGTGSTDNALFSIDGANLKTTTVFDFETKSSYSVRVRTTDAGGLSFETAITITVLNVNETPSAMAITKSNLYESNTINEVVGVLSTIDQDAGDSHTYSLVSGVGSTDNAAFNVSGNQVRASQVYNFSTKNSYSIRVQATDKGGLSFEKVYTVSVSQLPTLTGTGNEYGTQLQTIASTTPKISKGFTSKLILSGSDIVSYNWSPSASLSSASIYNPIAKPSQTQSYSVRVTNVYGSSTTLSITVEVMEDFKVVATNLLTPNGDGQNDKWEIENLSSYPNNQLVIMDRSYRVIYLKKDYANDWDGLYNGAPLPSDTYYFLLTFDSASGITVSKRGYITIPK